jgi:hypothetical protein
MYLFATPPPKKPETGGGNCKYVGTTNSKPPGPIMMIDQSKTGNRSQIIFIIALFSSRRCTAVLRLLPSLRELTIHHQAGKQNYFPDSVPIYYY